MSKIENTNPQADEAKKICLRLRDETAALLLAGNAPDSAPVRRVLNEARVWLIFWLVLRRYPAAEAVQFRIEAGRVRFVSVRDMGGQLCDAWWTGETPTTADDAWRARIDRIAGHLPVTDDQYYSLDPAWQYADFNFGDEHPIPTDWPFEIRMG